MELNDFLLDINERLIRLERMASNTISIGTVIERSADSRKYKVKLLNGPELSSVLQLSGGSGEFSSRFPLSAGEKVLIAAPSGDLRLGVILGSLELKENTEETKGDYYVKLPGGGVVRWNGKELALDVPANGLSIRGKAKIDGNLTVTGEVNASGNVFGADVVASQGNVSLGTHYHNFVSGKVTDATPGLTPAPKPKG